MKYAPVGEPRFDLDLEKGKLGECHVAELLDAIVSGTGRVEVKRKTILDLFFYIETQCDRGRTGTYRPSGISISTADVWAFVLGDSGITVFVPTTEIRGMLLDPSTQDREETHGSCPTKGKLIGLAVLLYRYRRRSTQGLVTPITAASATPGRIVAPTVTAITADDIRW